MAEAGTFNPDVQEGQPANFMYWSRPIEQPKANQSQETLLKGTGSVFDKGAATAVKVQEMNIDQQVDEGVDKYRDAATQRLKTAYEDVSGKQYGVLPESPLGGTDAPARLQDRLKGLDTLDAAKQSGKYSETYLYSQYASLAKDIRGKYPGFRDYIDERFKRSTGVDPANAVVAKMQQDINSYFTNKADAGKHIATEVDNYIMKGGDDLQVHRDRALYDQGKITAQQLRDSLGRANAFDYNLNKMKAQGEAVKMDADTKKINARSAAGYILDKLQGDFVSNYHLPGQEFSAAQLQENLRKASTDTQTKQKYGELLSQYETVARQQFEKKLRETGPDGRSIADDLGGPDEVKKQIDDSMTFFATNRKWMEDEKFGPVAAAANAVKAKTDDIWKDVSQTDIGTHMLMTSKIMKDNPEFGHIIVSQMNDAYPNAPQQLRALITDQHLRLLSGLSPLSGQPIDPAHPQAARI